MFLLVPAAKQRFITRRRSRSPNRLCIALLVFSANSVHFISIAQGSEACLRPDPLRGPLRGGAQGFGPFPFLRASRMCGGDAGDADVEAGSDDEEAHSMLSCGGVDEAAAGSGRETAAPAIYSGHDVARGDEAEDAAAVIVS